MPKTVIIYDGSAQYRSNDFRELLAEKFCKSRDQHIDDWHERRPLYRGFVHFTHTRPQKFYDDVLVLSFDQAVDYRKDERT